MRGRIPRPRIYRKSCIKHAWGHWSAEGSDYKLIKQCKYCNDILTVPEFFKIRKEKKLAVEQIQRKHLDLFWG